MARMFLRDIIEDLRFEDLPYNWNSFDLESFSKGKKLWDYQIEAVKNAIKVIWKYFEDLVNYQENETLELNQERKKKFFNWYKDNGLYENLDIRLDKRKRNIFNLLTEYYTYEDKKISYEYFINRMCFWMATGSGKTLVIIKLIEILAELIKRKEIPSYDILILTHRDDLIEQFKKMVDEFNRANEEKIILKELKEYQEIKRQRMLFGTPIFYYRSDNLSDEQKVKIIDFKNYDNDGKWYIFLDEAHKGDREEAKRQHIYSILSRNGFLFNSSATFIDPRDVITCAFEFNLSSFINAGYGKHISILKQEIRAFRDDEDYTGEEKQKIVLKSLIFLTYVKKFYKDIKEIRSNLYHKPLLLTLVNSVNTEDADLKLFFRELEKIGKAEIEKDIFKTSINELWDELKHEPEFMFEDGSKIKINEQIFKGISKTDILNYVFNAETSGEIEILRRPSNRKELAFKLKTCNSPFALIKIGDISGWLKEELIGYEIQERFEDESYFENLNREDSEINILMGSRGFYEGWDSNRPNLINYINIGIGTDAKKFILQSVGRGVRIEPIKDKRKRLFKLFNQINKEINEDLFNKIKDKVQSIETLFIFGTNRKALEFVIGELKKESKKENEKQLTIFDINKEAKKHTLLIPTYKLAVNPLIKNKKLQKFEMSKEDFKVLNKFIKFISDDRILLMLYNTEPEKVKILKDSLNIPDNYKYGEKNFKNLDLLIQRIFDYFSIVPQEFKNLKELTEEIRHFKNIKVNFKEINEIQKKIERVKNYPIQVKELQELYGKIQPKEYTEMAKNLKDEEDFESDHKKIIIKFIANHYYIPIVLSKDEKVDYIKHIIKTKSETKFIEDLVDYLAQSNNKFKDFDWWFFSKLDESLDEVYIPYYNPNSNMISDFYPDFIFWLKKEDNYFIVFVDPKGIEHISGWTYKIDNGFKELFEENGDKRFFDHNSFKVKIDLKFRTDDISRVPSNYTQYWFDNIEKMVKVVK
ncbi:MAG: DEAD/DEAH box helicase family protein [Candidatus Cloacimonetes bacterium]|nr:DEAD/DEAH box helicase family protein [Candidatus Cloacimonadota bacterium]